MTHEEPYYHTLQVYRIRPRLSLSTQQVLLTPAAKDLFFPESIRKALAEDGSLRPIFMVSMANKVGKLKVFDAQELGEIGGEALLDKLSVFAIGSEEQAREIARNGGEIIIGLADKRSNSLLHGLGFEVIHGRQVYFPLPDGTWLEVKGCGQLHDSAKPPFWYNAYDGGRPRYEGLCLEEEAQNAFRNFPQIKNSGARFVRLIASRSLEYVFDGKGFVKSCQAKSVDDPGIQSLKPVLVFSRVIHPHRLMKLPQLFNSDPGLENLRRRLSKVAGMKAGEGIMSLREFLEMIVAQMGRQEGVKQSKRLYKITIHEGDPF